MISAAAMTPTHSSNDSHAAFFAPAAFGISSATGASFTGSTVSSSSTEGTSEDIYAIEGPDAHEHAADDVGFLDEVRREQPRVVGIRAVVAHHEIGVGRDRVLREGIGPEAFGQPRL